MKFPSGASLDAIGCNRMQSQVIVNWVSSLWDDLQRVGQPTLSRACAACATLLDSSEGSTGSPRVSSELLRQMLTTLGQRPFSSTEADSMLRYAADDRNTGIASLLPALLCCMQSGQLQCHVMQLIKACSPCYWAEFAVDFSSTCSRILTQLAVFEARGRCTLD